jgi:hypothetical protein
MAKKIKIQYKGMRFELRESALRKTTYNGTPTTPYINIGNVEAGSIVKQYINQLYPTLKVWVKSENGSISSSVHINIAAKTGEKVSQMIVDNIKVFADSLRSGSFNGMFDTFEYRDDKPTTDNGTRIDMNCNYVFIDNYVPYRVKRK